MSGAIRGEEKILLLMGATDQPLVITGVRVQKWRDRQPPFDPKLGRYVGALHVGVTPLLSHCRAAYQAEIAGRRVSVQAAWSLIKKGQITPERRWHIRGRFRLARSWRGPHRWGK